MDRRLLRRLAERHGFDVIEVAEGRQAIEAARKRVPDLLVLDIGLPDVDGMTVLSEIRDEHPYLPVVIVTASDDDAHLKEALTLGAVNFVRKPITHEELGFVLDRIHLAVKEEADLHEVLEYIERRQTTLSFHASPSILTQVVAYLGRELGHHYPGFRVPLADVKLALYEALANAFEHGNLEISYDEKSRALDEIGGLDKLIANRLADARYATRRVHVEANYHPDEVEYRIRDEGQGFNPKEFELQRSFSHTTALHGRGLALIRHYMDEVSWGESGSEIRLRRRLVLRRDLPGAEARTG